VARFTDIEDMEVWQRSRQLVNRIYHVTKSNPFSRDFALCNQIRKTAISIPSNIAEGFERNGNDWRFNEIHQAIEHERH
jgi:four helix bundle protein